MERPQRAEKTGLRARFDAILAERADDGLARLEAVPDGLGLPAARGGQSGRS